MRQSVKSLVLIVTAIVGCSVSALGVPIPENVSVSGILPDQQNEQQVWICPADTSIIVIVHRDFRLGYRQIGLARSTDGGATWTDTLIAPSYQLLDWQSDPYMTVNSQGHFIIGHIDFDPVDNESYLAFLTSTDKGLTWNGPYTVEDTAVAGVEDKPFIACDRSGSAFDGSVYVAWNRGAVMFSASADGGHTFDGRRDIVPDLPAGCTGSAGNPFPQPMVGEDGTVYVFWLGLDWDTTGGDCVTHTAVRMTKSEDGGATWNEPSTVGLVNAGGDIESGVVSPVQAVTDADLSNGAHAGNIYCQYRSQSAVFPFDSEIYFQRSLDNGQTWSAPLRVNDDPMGVDVDQFHNWMVCNGDGILVSVWYDQRTDSNHYEFDVFAAYSFDGGVTWSGNHRVSSASINPDFLSGGSQDPIPGKPGYDPLPVGVAAPQGAGIAEYIGVSAVGDKIVATWTDTRMEIGGPDTWAAHWYLPLTDPRLIEPTNAGVYDSTQGLVWATAWKEWEDRYRLQVARNSLFTDVVRDTILDVTVFNDSLAGLEGGTLYYWRLKAYRAPAGVATDSTDFSAPWVFALGALDDDGDGVVNELDNCPATANPFQENSDGDSFGDACDNCPDVTNERQFDLDTNGVGDLCDCAVEPAVPGGTIARMEWVKDFGGTSMSSDYGRAIRAPSPDDVYVAGRTVNSGTGADYELVKYDAGGNQVWHSSFNSSGTTADDPSDLDLDEEGNTYVTGTGGGKYYTVKFGPDGGAPIWSRAFSGLDEPSTDVGVKVVVGQDNLVYAAGKARTYGGSGAFVILKYASTGLGLGTYELAVIDPHLEDFSVDGEGAAYFTGFDYKPLIGGDDCLTGKYDPSGNLVWLHRFDGAGGSADDRSHSMTLDRGGNVLVAGLSTQPGTGIDMATLKFAPDGTLLWTRYYDGPSHGTDSAIVVCADYCGNVYVAGSSQQSGSDFDYLLLKYDSEGNLLWERRYSREGITDDKPIDMVLDSEGSVCITGHGSGTGLPKTIITLKYNSDGDLLWKLPYQEETIGGVSVADMDIDAESNLYLTGAASRTDESINILTIKYSVLPCDCSSHGDISGDDGYVDLLDIVGLIDIVFIGAAPATADPQCPHVDRGDVTCDGIDNVQDIVHLIDYVYRGGLATCNPCLCFDYPASCP